MRKTKDKKKNLFFPVIFLKNLKVYLVIGLVKQPDEGKSSFVIFLRLQSLSGIAPY